mmetsp:Transcript_32735/g.59324  ORF Transcript_32735/g.59324 Transcript_32735/m.59324 type:complete len:469 (-) Transcript_32735:95-1501(-)|eukprot:CAMPEP_0175061114 /NCGR_PEP_ID=MMETSP0052_2-20121109/13407_1 /TAXON_ID=51329 ORGANISM="Polytomella parva, Strain SAG 63-3" /NCGR_SAMPLE_ID=MMETSP0052_2 /ASSEMBLY_ACC=CAM_ASM_000194 /LENGTH=468 /DNA_ID=CAMNT_0016326937 /DNA_START=42 /DNA_END=1448 /DNA_ORIENTATION=+
MSDNISLSKESEEKTSINLLLNIEDQDNIKKKQLPMPSAEGLSSNVPAEKFKAPTITAKEKTEEHPATLNNSAFMDVLVNRIKDLESAMNGPSNAAERETAKGRKKFLREVTKYCSDLSKSSQERLEWLQSKFSAQVSETLHLDKKVGELQRELDVSLKDKERIQNDLRRTHLMKDRLEDLCRKLQKDAKDVCEEARLKQEEDLQHRKDLESRFGSAIKDVSARMDEQQAERDKQLQENNDLRGKLEEVVKQFDTFQKLLQKKELEVKLHQARYEQQETIAKQLEMKASALEKTNELLKREAASGQVTQQENTVLRSQLQEYLSKFEDIQSTLGKSNKMFDRLRAEVNEHQKLRLKVSSECSEWRRKAEMLEATSLLRQAEEKKDVKTAKTQVNAIREVLEDEETKAADVKGANGTTEDIVGKVKRIKMQKEKLEGLCRILQQEIKTLKQVDNSHIETATSAVSECAL